MVAVSSACRRFFLSGFFLLPLPFHVPCPFTFHVACLFHGNGSEGAEQGRVAHSKGRCGIHLAILADSETEGVMFEVLAYLIVHAVCIILAQRNGERKNEE